MERSRVPPQAWSAAALFGGLAACLGLELMHRDDEIRFVNPVLPYFLDGVIIRNLRLGRSRIDVRLHRHDGDVTANVLSRQGSAKLLILK